MKNLKEFLCNLTLAQAILIAIVILVLGVSFNINRLINTANEIACYALVNMQAYNLDCSTQAEDAIKEAMMNKRK